MAYRVIKCFYLKFEMKKLIYIFFFLCFISCDKNSIPPPTTCFSSVQMENIAEYPTDPLEINTVYLEDGKMFLNITYSGGCEEHVFTLIQTPLFCGTPPIVLIFNLSHNNGQDGCEVLITQDLCFDITNALLNWSYTDDVSVMLYYPDLWWSLN